MAEKVIADGKITNEEAEWSYELDTLSPMDDSLSFSTTRATRIQTHSFSGWNTQLVQPCGRAVGTLNGWAAAYPDERATRRG